MRGLTRLDYDGIAISSIIASCISIVCLLLMGSSLIYFRKQQRSFRMRLALCLCISVLAFTFPALIAMSFFYHHNNDDNKADAIPKGLCKFQGFVLQWFLVSTDLWTAATALYVYMRVVHQKYLEDYEKYVYAVCWGLPCILAIIPLFGVGGGYMVVSSWCWIESSLVRLFFLYVPVWINFFFMATLYILVFRHTTKVNRSVNTTFEQGDRDAERQKKRAKLNFRVIRKLSGYAVVFVIVWIPGTINRIQNFVSPDSPLAGLYQAQAFTLYLAGALYFIAYGIHNKTIVSYLWNRKLKRASNSSNTNSNSHSTSNAVTTATGSRHDIELHASTRSEAVDSSTIA